MIDFNDIDRQMRRFDTRLTWVESAIQGTTENQRDYTERLQTLYDLLESLKSKISKKEKA